MRKNKYYKLSQFREANSPYGGWEHIYFSVDVEGKLTIISRDDMTHVSNSKLEKLSEEEGKNVIEVITTIRDTSYG